MAIGVVEVDDMTNGFLKRLLGFVFHHNGVAKAAVETLEDVPARRYSREWIRQSCLDSRRIGRRQFE